MSHIEQYHPYTVVYICFGVSFSLSLCLPLSKSFFLCKHREPSGIMSTKYCRQLFLGSRICGNLWLSSLDFFVSLKCFINVVYIKIMTYLKENKGMTKKYQRDILKKKKKRRSRWIEILTSDKVEFKLKSVNQSMRDIKVWQKIQFEGNTTAINFDISNNIVIRFRKLKIKGLNLKHTHTIIYSEIL